MRGSTFYVSRTSLGDANVLRFLGPEETNKRFHYLLSHGETGLSIAFQYPTLLGYDSDLPMARDEIGKCGWAIDNLKDMEILFEGVHLDKVTTSMTTNLPASILLAMHIVVAEKQGVRKREIGGTIQNDVLMEFIAQKTFMLPPKLSLRIIMDAIEDCTREVPRWNAISISGYQIREAGGTAAEVIDLLKKKGAEDFIVFGVGIIPEQNISALTRCGVKAVFTPGAPIEEAVKWVREKANPRKE